MHTPAQPDQPDLSDPDTNIKYMFDPGVPGSVPGDPSPAAHGTVPPEAGSVEAVPPDVVPLERLEAQICELAGHLTAATCRFLVLLGDFDARRGCRGSGTAP